MKTKILLSPLVLLVTGALTAAAGEFPDSWTDDNKPELREAHAAFEGKPMPALQASDWINGGITADDMKGKVVVVDFYATWCPDCMKAIPQNNKLLKKYKQKGLVVIGICTHKRGQEDFVANAKKHDIQYPAARDPDLKLQEEWAVHYYPTYAIIDRKGIVRVVGLQPDYLKKVVKKLLAEPAS